MYLQAAVVTDVEAKLQTRKRPGPRFTCARFNEIDEALYLPAGT